jgi:hypothetical protein
MRVYIVSWVLALLSVVGSRMNLLTLDLSAVVCTAERAEVRLSRVGCGARVADGDGNKLYLPPMALESRNKVGVFRRLFG